MQKRLWTLTALCAAVGMTWTLAESLAKPPDKEAKGRPAAGKDAADDVFGLTRLHEFHLTIPAKDWETMQPARGPFPFGPGGGRPGGPGPAGPGGGRPDSQPPAAPGAARPAAVAPVKPADKPADVHKGHGFGMEYPWVHAEFTAEGKTYKNVGVRFKGNASYMMSSRGLKRPIKIDFEHYVDDQRFHGLKTLNLNNGVMDPTKAHEALSYALFRAAGVPAPRTAFAEVYLTVPGKYDKEYVGIYTLIEQVGKAFLKDHFKSAKGLLLKPEGIRGLEYLGDDWAAYERRYVPKTEAGQKLRQRLVDFTRLVNQAGNDQFKKEIRGYLDVDGFLRFMAVNALISNLDSFLGLGHNYYLYLDPKTNKFVFFPWDLDLSFAGFPMAGGPDQQMDLSIDHPYMGNNKLVDRLMAIDEIKAAYRKHVRQITETSFTTENLFKEIDAIEKLTAPLIAKERKAAEARKEGGGFGMGPGGPGGPFGGTPVPLKTMVEKRISSVNSQLAGKSKGFVPTMGFGPGGGLGNAFAKPVLQALDTDKDGKASKDELVAGVKRFFKECDKENKGTLDEKALAEGIARLLPRPPGPGGGPAPGGPGAAPGPRGAPPGGRPGFGPGNMFAGAILRRADANKDGKVSLDELIVAAEGLFKEIDKGNKGKLDEGALVAAINLVAPQGGRPGGFENPLVKPLFAALDADKNSKVSKDEFLAGAKKFFQDSDKSKKGTLDEAALAEGINRVFPRPPGFGPGGGGPGPGAAPGGPPGFGPGNFFAGAILRRADSDKDGKVTRDEFVPTAATLFQEADKDKKGVLDEKALGAAFGLLFPPPGFGPPPGDRPARPPELRKEAQP